MSNVIVSDLGIEAELGWILAQWISGPLRIHLFKNNITPDKATVLADFVEAAFTGYVTAGTPSWSEGAVAGHVAPAAHPPIVFTVTVDSPGEVVYGYYVTDTASTQLYWSERYDAAPAAMDTAGQTFTVVLKRTVESKFG